MTQSERAALLEAMEQVNKTVLTITVPPMWLFVSVMVIAPAGLLWLLWMLYA